MWLFKPRDRRLAQKALYDAGEILDMDVNTLYPDPPLNIECIQTGIKPNGDGTHSFTHDPDPTEAFEQAAREVGDTPRETISAEDRDTVAFHVDNIGAVLQSVQNRRASVTETRAARREQFEADDAADAARIAELDRLTAVYEAALLTAKADGPVITGDLKGLGMHEQAVDAVALSEVGKKIARTRRKASARVDQGGIGAVDMG